MPFYDTLIALSEYIYPLGMHRSKSALSFPECWCFCLQTVCYIYTHTHTHMDKKNRIHSPNPFVTRHHTRLIFKHPKVGFTTDFFLDWMPNEPCLPYYLPICGEKLKDLCLAQKHCKMQTACSGFELWLLIPFPKMLTVMLSIPTQIV